MNRESFGIRIASDPVARLWGGHGDLIVPADIVESGPATYLGAGELINAPDYQMLINGEAERLDITLSGVSAETVRLALDDAPSVRGAKVHFVRFEFDDSWQLVEVAYEAVFRADKLSVSSQNDEKGRARAITLSIGSEDTDRSRSPLAYFTAQDQARRSASDTFFSHISSIAAGTSRRFGAR